MATDILGRPVNHQMIKPHKFGGTPQEREKRRRAKLALSMALEGPLAAQAPHWMIEEENPKADALPGPGASQPA